MQPIGPLMHEHRLADRLIRLLRDELARIETGAPPDSRFIDQSADFFRYYLDRCHHGKEEDILFRELKKKPLSNDEARILNELTEEHVRGRALVKALREANLAAARGAGPASAVAPLLKNLTDFYPAHIEKEDKRFFHPVMRLFSRQEMDAMLAEFEAVDGRVFREKYADLVAEREKLGS